MPGSTEIKDYLITVNIANVTDILKKEKNRYVTNV